MSVFRGIVHFAKKVFSYMLVYELLIGGDEENRTPVRKHATRLSTSLVYV